MNSCGSKIKVFPGASSTSAPILANRQLTKRLGQYVFPILQNYMTYQKAESGTFLWQEGDDSNSLVLILEGKLDAQKETGFPNHPFLTGIFYPGTIVGEDGFIHSLPRNTSVRAIDSCDLLILSRHSFGKLEKQHPEIANLILKWLLDLVSKRLRHTQKRLSAIF